MKAALLWLLASITDHNGKPSYTRIVSWIWTGFSIKWVDHIVMTSGELSEGALMLVLISLLGPMMVMIMKKAPSEAAFGFLNKLWARKKDDKP